MFTKKAQILPFALLWRCWAGNASENEERADRGASRRIHCTFGCQRIHDTTITLYDCLVFSSENLSVLHEISVC